MTAPATNRTIGFRSRLEARFAALLEQARREGPGEGPGATAESLATAITPHVSRFVDALIEGKSMQQAVLDRAWLVENWSLTDHAAVDPPLEAHLRQLALLDQRLGKSPHPTRWPMDVTLRELSQALHRTGDADAVWLASQLEAGLLGLRNDGPRGGSDPEQHAPDSTLGVEGEGVSAETTRALRRWPLLPCARVVATYNMVLADLRKPAIALDTGKVHHELMAGWGRAAQKRQIVLEKRPDRVELFLPGAEHKPAALSVPFDGEHLTQAFVEAIKEWRSFLGLRHWIALQALFSIQGKREGKVLWKLDEHLDALGVSKRWREDRQNRISVAREVSLLTKMQLVIYRPDGTVRARHNVLLTTAEIDVEQGGQWLLEGLELQMHPWLYNGVRDQKSGQLGKHWYPVPPALAKVDHDKFRHALSLGVMLPIRWKWAWAQGTDHVTIAAGKLLELACIEPTPLHPGRGWDALEASLAELERIKLLGHVRWEGERHTLAAKVSLYPADWLIDRTVQGLQPVERALPPPLPTNGAELAIWRKERRLTKAGLAAQLNINERTIRRTEDDLDKPLGRALLAALEMLRRDPSTLSPEPSSSSTQKV